MFLVRHGETSFNRANKDGNQSADEPLTYTGKKQVIELANVLKWHNIEKVYSSDLKRALETSRVLHKLLNVRIVSDKRLREYEQGEINPSSDEWILKYKELLSQGISKYDIRPFGGENIWDLIKRVNSFIQEIQKGSGVIVIVGHAAANEIFINLIQNREKKDFLKIKQDNACINILEFKDSKWQISVINDSDHLNSLEPKIRAYNNQADIIRFVKQNVLSKFGEYFDRLAFTDRIVNNEIGVYSRTYKRYDGTPIEMIGKLHNKRIYQNWKISTFKGEIYKYEIDTVEIGGIKHKINVTLTDDFEAAVKGVECIKIK